MQFAYATLSNYFRIYLMIISFYYYIYYSFIKHTLCNRLYDFEMRVRAVLSFLENDLTILTWIYHNENKEGVF